MIPRVAAHGNMLVFLADDPDPNAQGIRFHAWPVQTEIADRLIDDGDPRYVRTFHHAPTGEYRITIRVPGGNTTYTLNHHDEKRGVWTATRVDGNPKP